MTTRPIEGVGIGLRASFADALLRTKRQVDWLEVTPENWVFGHGKKRALLDACIDRWPSVSHSVSLSIGGTDALDEPLIAAISAFNERARAPFWSDHFCYSSVGGRPLHDLLPLPFNQQVIEHLGHRAEAIRRRIEAPLVLENATYYARMPGSNLDEASFLVAALDATKAGMLLDVNNVYVNALNHGFSPEAFIDRMPLDRVVEIHVAGHTRQGDVVIDTHIGPTPDPVWDLYRYTLAKARRMIPTLVEWDQDIPELDVVLDEVDRARAVAAEALARKP